jgi:hypothetical protein
LRLNLKEPKIIGSYPGGSYNPNYDGFVCGKIVSGIETLGVVEQHVHPSNFTFTFKSYSFFINLE